jgi:hypothetical protein
VVPLAVSGIIVISVAVVSAIVLVAILLRGEARDDRRDHSDPEK